MSATEALRGAMIEPQTVTVPLKEWLQLHRDLGHAEGLLGGWLHAGDDTSQAKAATERFLAREGL